MVRWIAVLGIGLCVAALGCGSSEDMDDASERASDALENAGEAGRRSFDSARDAAGRAADSAREAAGGAADMARDAAGSAADTARETASGAAGAAREMGADARDSLRDVATGPGNDAVADCLSLAARQAWDDALDPCTRAAKLKPDDLRIKHAVQQARAAAGQ